MEDEAERLLLLARHLYSTNNFKKSFQKYLRAFERDPRIKGIYQDEFRDTLARYNELLFKANKIENIFANFSKALELFPTNPYIINDVGKYLYKYGFYFEAWAHFHKSLTFNSNYVCSERNLNSIKNLLLERWHFRMLNDKNRNEAYYNALSECIIKHKDSVLDIGTGSGILAMFASDCAATAVTGIESSEYIAYLAESVTQGNCKNDIVIVNKMSTTLNYRDIGGKRSLVVTEMFDAGLIGEHILQTLAHAWEYFMVPTSRIIPNKAEFFVMAAKSEYLGRRYRLCTQVSQLLNIPPSNVQILMPGDCYDCEDVHLIKDIQYLAEPQSVMKIDFNDYRDIQEKLCRNEPYVVEFTAKEDSEINIFIGWFNLYLTENITITTDPRSDKRSNAWQQPIFFDFIPKDVKKDDNFEVHFSTNEGKFAIENFSGAPKLKISPATLRFLNDNEFVKRITDCIGMASIYLGQLEDISHNCILDLSPFPLFGLLMMKRGAKSLTCYARTSEDKIFFRNVFKANNIQWSKITILEGEACGPDVFNNCKYHAIFCNIIDICGDTEFQFYEFIPILKNNHLVRGGLFMPSNVDLHIQVINSNWVDINNRVYDENVMNFKIAEFINKYEVTQNFCIDLLHMDYTPVTESHNLGTLEPEAKLEPVNIPVIQTGLPNAIMCWYSIEIMPNMAEVTTRRPESFADGMLFLISPKAPYTVGKSVPLIYCVDSDGSFKLRLSSEDAQPRTLAEP